LYKCYDIGSKLNALKIFVKVFPQLSTSV
jgi:hypothetical protein